MEVVDVKGRMGSRDLEERTRRGKMRLGGHEAVQTGKDLRRASNEHEVQGKRNTDSEGGVRLRSDVERGKRSARNWCLPSGHEAQEGEARLGET